MNRHDIALTVNGKTVTGTVEPRMSLLDFLRSEIGLTGTHMGCEHGVCGACSVLLDEVPVRSCLILAVQAHNHNITTVEGLCNEDGSTGDLQDAFRDAHGMQCGYCTPGMLISAHALLEKNSNPSVDDIKEAIGGNLCRCTGYVQIIEAIQLAASRKMEAGQ
ncbi:MAG: (2Fe-2S)-binding protein [Rhodospirillales bacterium]|nr:(2Fe-2S)-binding protein [Rhodospirillales bacterium]